MSRLLSVHATSLLLPRFFVYDPATAAALRRDRWWLLIVALLVLAAGLGLRDPWPADEPRFALVAKEMVDSGQWFFPRRAGELYPDKPPVFMWLIAAFYALTGSLRLSFLLPSLLAALASLLLVHDIAARLWNRRVALLAAVALLATFQFALQARTAQIDATLAMWTTLGVYGLLRHLVLGPAWRWYYLAWIAMGLGVITKGTGFLPLLMLIPYAYGRWRGWQGLASFPARPWQWALGPVLLLAAIALWLVPMLLLVQASQDPALLAYRDNILLRQTAERYANPWHHYQPAWYYLTNVIPWFWLPLTLALPWLVPAWWRRLRRGDGRLLLLLGWVVLVVLFFSLSPAKRGVYVLPALAAFVLAAAPLLPGLLARPRLHHTAFVALLVLGAVPLALAAGLEVLQPQRLQAIQQDYGFDPRPLLVLVGGLALLWGFGARPARGAYALAGFLLTLWLVHGWVAYPQLNPARSTAPFMREVGKRIGPEAELALLGWKEQFVLFADRPVTTFGYMADKDQEARQAAAWLLGGEQRAALLPEQALEPCFARELALFLGRRHRGEWFLVGPEAVTAACRPTPAP